MVRKIPVIDVSKIATTKPVEIAGYGVTITYSEIKAPHFKTKAVRPNHVGGGMAGFIIGDESSALTGQGLDSGPAFVAYFQGGQPTVPGAAHLVESQATMAGAQRGSRMKPVKLQLARRVGGGQHAII